VLHTCLAPGFRADRADREEAKIDAEEVPDAKTILKIAGALGPEVIEQLHRQVVEVVKRAGVTHGRRFRIDTTVVETNVHDPTDSSLLHDGMRVLTRAMQHACAALGDPRGRVRNRLRSVGRRTLIIGRQARSPETRDALVRSYRQLMATTRAVVRDATAVVRRISQRLPTAPASIATTLTRARQQLREMQPLVTRVLDQTRARLLGGDTHVTDKVLSVFEPHAEAIRKGNIAKPTEFGKLVTIQESEHQIITAYEVHDRRPADMTLWTPALDRRTAPARSFLHRKVANGRYARVCIGSGTARWRSRSMVPIVGDDSAGTKLSALGSRR
jgi:IS5 family transposase